MVLPQEVFYDIPGSVVVPEGQDDLEMGRADPLDTLLGQVGVIADFGIVE